MNKEYEHARVFITQPMLLNRSPSYGGKYVGEWGMIIKWYNQEGRTRYAVQLDGFINPKSRDGLFWFDRSELNIYIEEQENEMKNDSLESILKAAFEIKEVIFNDPATIIKWADGAKTVVKCNDGDRYDPEKGMALAIAKKALGNQGNYYEVFKKWLPDREENFWMYLKDAVIKGVPRPDAKPIGTVTHKDPLGASFTCKLTDEAAEAFQKIAATPISLGFNATLDEGLKAQSVTALANEKNEPKNEKDPKLPIGTKVRLSDNCNPLVLGFLAVAGIDKDDTGEIVDYEHDGYLVKFKGHTNLGRYDGLYWLHTSCVAVCD